MLVYGTAFGINLFSSGKVNEYIMMNQDTVVIKYHYSKTNEKRASGNESQGSFFV